MQSFSQQDQDKLCKIACLIAAIGSINWYTSTMGYNVVSMLFGDEKSNQIKPATTAEKLAYLVVGLSGVICLWCCSSKHRHQY